MEWDITRYTDKLPQWPANSGMKATQATEASLRQWYPLNDSATKGPISRPCIIVDMQGIILAWYLPGILKDSWKVSLFTFSITKSNTFDVRQKWWQQQRSYIHYWKGIRETTHGAMMLQFIFPGTESPRGLLNLSPVWFQQAHEVIVTDAVFYCL